MLRHVNNIERSRSCSWTLSGQVRGWARLAATLAAPSQGCGHLATAPADFTDQTSLTSRLAAQGPLCTGWRREVISLYPRTALQGVSGTRGRHLALPGLFLISVMSVMRPGPPVTPLFPCRPLGATRAPWASWRDGASWPPRPPWPSRQPGPPSKRPPRRPLLPAATNGQGQ